ncbi:hypothetical protein FDP41_008019 [Naegleria fowleri]|uniref:Uncharacterized protein n=1 Tax=Naegleria fowleri TaxID=5763 RepID=A0A6A5CC19_NAEFO|nr:uncharacterized protein FDP41_008019 [Naegleria fowleri]KAF0984104.1 hypothetical protein FDP41_008019 [Naegleria fowleri]CAG4719046.1 unnamed protein product [Naegleria fowleri]
MSEIDGEEEDFDQEQEEEEISDEDENDEEYIETDSEEEEGKVKHHHHEDDELSDEQEEDKDFPNFTDGLTLQGRLQVKNARKLYFDEKQREYNAMVAKEVSSKVKQKWNDIISNQQIASGGFDFQVLKNLLDSQSDIGTETSNVSRQQSLEGQLDIKQRGDHWNYTIGLNETNHHDEENEQANENTDEEDNEEDEEITDDDDDED